MTKATIIIRDHETEAVLHLAHDGYPSNVLYILQEAEEQMRSETNVNDAPRLKSATAVAAYLQSFEEDFYAPEDGKPRVLIFSKVYILIVDNDRWYVNALDTGWFGDVKDVPENFCTGCRWPLNDDGAACERCGTEAP